MFKLYFSRNLRRSDFNFKNVIDNYNFMYKGTFYSKLKKRYYKYKKDPRFDMPERALKTILLKQQSLMQTYHTNKIIKDKW